MVSTGDLITGGGIYSEAYYHQFLQTLSYHVSDGGSPTSPTATGTEFGSPYVPSLTPSASGYWFDASGSITFSTSTSGGVEHWAPNTSSISAASANTLDVGMYHQYQITASYSISDASSQSSAVILTGTTLGSGSTTTLTTSTQQVWLDAGSSWSVNNPIIASSGTEHWIATSGTSGIVGPATVVDTSYNHQFEVSFTQTGISSDAGAHTVLTLNGLPYAYNALPTNVWVDSGTTFSWLSPVAGISGEQFVHTGDSGPTSPITGSGINSATYLPQYYLTVSSPYGTTTGQGWYNSGAAVNAGLTSGTVSGGAGTQYVFTSWSGDASGAAFSSSNAITMNGPMAATANWQTQYQVSFAANTGGSTNPTGPNIWENAGSLSITATPNAGNAFSYWSSNTTSITFDNANLASATATISGPGTITAAFAINTYTITVTQTGNGQIAPGTTTVNYGGSQSFTITPSSGYCIASITADSGSVAVTSLTGQTVSFTNVQATHTLTAVYAPKNYTLTVYTIGQGSVTPGNGTYPYN